MGTKARPHGLTSVKLGNALTIQLDVAALYTGKTKSEILREGLRGWLATWVDSLPAGGLHGLEDVEAEGAS